MICVAKSHLTLLALGDVLTLMPIGHVSGDDVSGIGILTHLGRQTDLKRERIHHLLSGVISPLPVRFLIAAYTPGIAARVMRLQGLHDESVEAVQSFAFRS